MIMNVHFFRPIRPCYNANLSSLNDKEKSYRVLTSDSKDGKHGVRSYAAEKKIETCSHFFKKKPKEKKYKPVTHIIFDLDGTLINSEDHIFCASQKYIKRHFKKDLTWELYSMVMGTGSKESTKVIIQELKLPIDMDVYRHGIWQELRQKLVDHTKLQPGVELLVKQLYQSQIPIAVATSSSEDMYKLKSKKHKDFFDKFCTITFGSGEKKLLGKNKPRPDIFYLTVERFPVQPKENHNVLVIEDSLAGVRGAKAANMQVVMVPHQNTPKHIVELAEPTLLLKDLSDFRPALFNLPFN